MHCSSDEIMKILSSYNEERGKNVWKDKLKATDRPIVLFGAGAAGHFFAEKLLSWDIHPTCFCDNKKKGKDERYGLPIISFEDLCKEFKDAYIFISVNDAAIDSVKQQLIIGGFSNDQFISRIFLEDKISKESFTANLNRYHLLINTLEDDYSRAVVYEKLRYFLEYFEIKLSEPPNNQYFDPDIVTFEPNEVFVDGGAYNGDTLMEFVKRTRGRYKKILSFEPSTTSFKELSKVASAYQRVELFKEGLWQCEKYMLFKGDDWSKSRISETGNERIKCIALDDYFTRNSNIYPTFIKLDIEGAEAQALLGASRIIKKYKPKLAIAIYHNPNDIFEIPELIKQLNPDYKLFIRQYSKSNGEMICYGL